MPGIRTRLGGSANSSWISGVVGGGTYGWSAPGTMRRSRPSRRRFLLCFCAAASNGGGGTIGRAIGAGAAAPTSARRAASTAATGAAAAGCSATGRSASRAFSGAGACGASWRSFMLSSCRSISHWMMSRLRRSRRCSHSKMARDVSRLWRRLRMRWKAGPSFSRRLRVCGLWVPRRRRQSVKSKKKHRPKCRPCLCSFSRGLNTLNGFGSVTAGGGWSRRKAGLPRRLRLSSQ